MAAVDNFFFYEDEVFRVNSKGLIQFGTVVENSELVSSNDETSDSEVELHEDYKMKKGHIRVSWHPSGFTEVLSESKVGLADRSLMPGDVVKRLVKDKNTQRGYCNDIKIVATVQIVGTKLVIENLPTSQLSPLTTFSKDLAVYLDHWIGVTRDVHLKLLVSCSDGSKAYISDPYMLKSLLNQRKSKCLHEDFPRKSDFYPGQRLLASRYILASAQWLFKSPEFERLSSRHKHLKLTVERMEVDYVEVTWRCTAFTGNSAQPSLTPRESIVKGDDLKRLRVLNHFESCTNQVGDRMSYTPSAQDSILPLDVWRQKKREGMLASGVTLPVHHRRKSFPASRIKFTPRRKKHSSWSKVPGDGELDSTLIEQDATLLAQPGDVVSSDTTLVPDKEKGADVPSIVLIDAPSSGDSEDWDTEISYDSDYDDSTSCCTTETSSVASSRLNSESSNVDSTTSLPARCLEGNPDASTPLPTPLATRCLQGNHEGTTPLPTPLAARSLEGHDGTTPLPARSLEGHDLTTPLTARTPTPPLAPKRRTVALATRLMRRRNKAKTMQRGSRCDETSEVLGRHCVVEILCTQSSADVVWQDGSIEQNISSLDLYPIHYLDDKEFFPGDFVVKAGTGGEDGDSGSKMGEYGVVRQMDHVGRTAKIQCPECLGESEMSVYDIKDHPDFQFRPGSVVLNMGGVPSFKKTEDASSEPTTNSLGTAENKTAKGVPSFKKSKDAPSGELTTNNLATNENKTAHVKSNPAEMCPNGIKESKTAKGNSVGIEEIKTATVNSVGIEESKTATINCVGTEEKNETGKLCSVGIEDEKTAKLNSVGIDEKNETAKLNSSVGIEEEKTAKKDSVGIEEDRVYVGQVMDNFPEGQIKVWWVDGSITSVWPQDLYKIGEYNSDDGELWASSSSEDSWETEMETDASFLDGEDGSDYFSDAGGDMSFDPQVPLPFERLLARLGSDKPESQSSANTTSLAQPSQESSSTSQVKPPGGYELKLFRTILKLSHVLDVLEKDLAKTPDGNLFYASILHMTYKNLTYLDKLLGTSLFSGSQMESLLTQMRTRENKLRRIHEVPPNEKVEPRGYQDIMEEKARLVRTKAQTTSGDNDEATESTATSVSPGNIKLLRSAQLGTLLDELCAEFHDQSSDRNYELNSRRLFSLVQEMDAKLVECREMIGRSGSQSETPKDPLVECRYVTGRTAGQSETPKGQIGCETKQSCETNQIACKTNEIGCEANQIGCETNEISCETSQVSCAPKESGSKTRHVLNETEKIDSKLKDARGVATNPCPSLDAPSKSTEMETEANETCPIGETSCKVGSQLNDICSKFIQFASKSNQTGKLTVKEPNGIDPGSVDCGTGSSSNGMNGVGSNDNSSSSQLPSQMTPNRTQDLPTPSQDKYLALSSRCCAMLRSQLLRAHDQFILTYFPNHEHLCLLGDQIDTTEGSVPSDSINLPLHKNEKFQANMKYLKSKLDQSPHEAGSSKTETKMNTRQTEAPLTNENGEPSISSNDVQMKLPSGKSNDTNDTTGKLTTEPVQSQSECEGVSDTSKGEDDGLSKGSVNGRNANPECGSERPSELTANSAPFTSPGPIIDYHAEGFVMLDSVAGYPHKFVKRNFSPDGKVFFKAYRKEMTLLRTSLPTGIWVRGFEDRMDLLSVMIEGPRRTPYEDGLFYFDFHLPSNYPQAPPLCHYLSYCSDRLNPNLYETGKVCVSLLGTWSGRGTEVWTTQSTLLQILISIQGLILNAEPYYNEAGYERQRATQNGQENARMYNEMVLLKLVAAMGGTLVSPPGVFEKETRRHFRQRADKFTRRLEYWSRVSAEMSEGSVNGVVETSIRSDASSVEGSAYQVMSDGATESKETGETKNGTTCENKESRKRVIMCDIGNNCDKPNQDNPSVSTMVLDEGLMEVDVPMGDERNEEVEGPKQSNNQTSEHTKESIKPNAGSCNDNEISCNKNQASCNDHETSCNDNKNSCNNNAVSCNKNQASCNDNETSSYESEEFELPQFPLLPASRGFCLTLKSLIATFRNTLKRLEIDYETSNPVAETNTGKTATVAETSKTNTRKVETVEGKGIPDRSGDEKDKGNLGEEELVKDSSKCEENGLNLHKVSSEVGSILVSDGSNGLKPVGNDYKDASKTVENSTNVSKSDNSPKLVQDGSKSDESSSTVIKGSTRNSPLSNSQVDDLATNGTARSHLEDNQISCMDSVNNASVNSNSTLNNSSTVNNSSSLNNTATLNSNSTVNNSSTSPSAKSKSPGPEQSRLLSRNSPSVKARSGTAEVDSGVFGSTVIPIGESIHKVEKKKSLDSINNNNNKI
ncbi:hypothetical protein M8J75_011563 [Diaphorina citri]|nr:hypothetical protein M8J75_011563 [Diaphorina citri]